jgi:glycosyltransferase involved in cell wall biosynthesis
VEKKSLRPIRILRIIARLNIGGPAIQAATLSARLSKDAFQTLLVCGTVAAGEGDMSYLALSEGIQPEVLPSLGREISLLDDFRTLRDLRKIIRDFKPHIIHTHTAKAGTLGRIAGIGLKSVSGTKIRLVHTFHGHVFNGYFSSRKTALFVQIERFLARFTDRIVVISPRQLADISFRYRIADPHKVRLIPLGFDLAPFRDNGRHTRESRREMLGFGNENIRVVGIIGRLTRIKNHRMLLDAVKILREADPVSSIRILVVGDGESRQELEQYARELGVSDLVVFAGWHKDMPGVYGIMDAVVLTSRNEGTPVTLIEAMAAGIPVIATAVGGVPDLLGRSETNISGFQIAERGILVNPGDARALADALIFILKSTDASARMIRRAREHVMGHHSIERLLGDMKQLYDEVLQE